MIKMKRQNFRMKELELQWKVIIAVNIYIVKSNC